MLKFATLLYLLSFFSPLGTKGIAGGIAKNYSLPGSTEIQCEFCVLRIMKKA